RGGRGGRRGQLVRRGRGDRRQQQVPGPGVFAEGGLGAPHGGLAQLLAFLVDDLQQLGFAQQARLAGRGRDGAEGRRKGSAAGNTAPASSEAGSGRWNSTPGWLRLARPKVSTSLSTESSGRRTPWTPTGSSGWPRGRACRVLSWR